MGTLTQQIEQLESDIFNIIDELDSKLWTGKSGSMEAQGRGSIKKTHRASLEKISLIGLNMSNDKSNYPECLV